jgi:hypothetical protein
MSHLSTYLSESARSFSSPQVATSESDTLQTQCCGEIYIGLRSFLAHGMSAHSDCFHFTCISCQQAFSSHRKDWICHLQDVHQTDSRPLPCPGPGRGGLCNKTFESLMQLKRHLPRCVKTPTNCLGNCGKSFGCVDDLRRHQRQDSQCSSYKQTSRKRRKLHASEGRAPSRPLNGGGYIGWFAESAPRPDAYLDTRGNPRSKS